ncbi:hypothetical protein RDABS01_012945, partial [Bienertia sinuspersici]
MNWGLMILHMLPSSMTVVVLRTLMLPAVLWILISLMTMI